MVKTAWTVSFLPAGMFTRAADVPSVVAPAVTPDVEAWTVSVATPRAGTFPWLSRSTASDTRLPVLNEAGNRMFHRFCTSMNGGATTTGTADTAVLSAKLVSATAAVGLTLATRKVAPFKPAGQMNRGKVNVACRPGRRFMFLLMLLSSGALPRIFASGEA